MFLLSCHTKQPKRKPFESARQLTPITMWLPQTNNMVHMNTPT